MSEIKVDSSELENLIGEINGSVENLNINAVNPDSSCGITCNAEGLVAYQRYLSDMKNVLNDYKTLLKANISQIEKSKEQLEQMDSETGSAIAG